MKEFLVYQETSVSRLRPRHPVLCVQDLLGLFVLLTLVVWYRPDWVVALLPLSMTAVYIASLVHHWLPHHLLRQKIDHQMITLLIGMTFIPYWSVRLETTEAVWRVGALLVFTTFVSIVRWQWCEKRNWGGLLYLALAAFPLISSRNELFEWMPAHAVEEFWIGIACYGINFAVYHARWPNPLPELFGFREVQHVFVILSITMQAHVVLAYCRP